MQAWCESPIDLGSLFAPIIAKGQAYPHGKNYGLFLYGSLIWIYFVVATQKGKKSMREHWLLSFFVVNNAMKNPANCHAICRVCARLHDGFPQILAQTWVQNPPAPAKSLGRFRSDREKRRFREISPAPRHQSVFGGCFLTLTFFEIP